MNRELEAFKKFYPLLHGIEKASAPTETIADDNIITQTETDAYADENQICLEI